MVFAQNQQNPRNQPQQQVAPNANMPIVFNVNGQGKVMMRGIVNSVSNGTIILKSWGGDWIIRVSPQTKILPGIAKNDITKFKAGDLAGVQGMVDKNASWTIDANLARDWNMK